MKRHQIHPRHDRQRSLVNREVVAGGGAIEMEISSILSANSKTTLKQQLIMAAFAKALEVIPRQVSDNAGMDSTDVLNRLRTEHFRKTIDTTPQGIWMGVDVLNEGICDTFASGVWEPAANKMNSIAAATEAACCVLSIDETVKNPLSEKPQGPSAQEQQAGRQMVSQGMGGGGLGASQVLPRAPCAPSGPRRRKHARLSYLAAFARLPLSSANPPFKRSNGG